MRGPCVAQESIEVLVEQRPEARHAARYRGLRCFAQVERTRAPVHQQALEASFEMARASSAETPRSRANLDRWGILGVDLWSEHELAMARSSAACMLPLVLRERAVVGTPWSALHLGEQLGERRNVVVTLEQRPVPARCAPASNPRQLDDRVDHRRAVGVQDQEP